MDATHLFSAGAPYAVALSAGLLAARIVFGLYMASHGAQKLFGWFGGYGIAGTSGYFEQIGFRPGRVFAAVASAAECFGGLATAIGFLGPIGPALMVSVMVVAIGIHWGNGLFTTPARNGIELALLYAVGAFALALSGPGVFSLDKLLGLEGIWTPEVAWTILAIGVAGGVANLAIRRPSVEAANNKEGSVVPA